MARQREGAVITASSVEWELVAPEHREEGRHALLGACEHAQASPVLPRSRRRQHVVRHHDDEGEGDTRGRAREWLTAVRWATFATLDVAPD